MPSSGGTTGIPVTTPPGPPALEPYLTQPLPYTLLSLPRYARIMGIPPLHFWGASAPNLLPQKFPVAQCNDVFYKYSWQDADKMSRSDILFQIASAEEEISRVLGYWPAPTWIHDERQDYPRFFARETYSAYGVNNRWFSKSIIPEYGRIVAVGQPALTLIGSPEVVYQDNDSDGYFETAVVSVATAVTDIRELYVTFQGYSGNREWEIRNPRKSFLSSGIATFVFDSVLFIDPALHEFMPTEESPGIIDVSTTANFVEYVDVYREYVDTTQATGEFVWMKDVTSCTACGGTGCEACEETTQDACINISDHSQGILVPRPASYTGGEWVSQSWNGGRDPDYVKYSYKAGEVSQDYRRGRSNDPLSDQMAKAIAYLATARLERPLCGCTNVEALSVHLQGDITMTGPGANFVFTTEEIAENVFGTRRGEIVAWKMLVKLGRRRGNFAVI